MLERGNAYRAAIADTSGSGGDGQQDALAQVLAGEIWSGSPETSAAARALADYVRAVDASLAKHDGVALAAGSVTFPEMPQRT